MGSVLESAWRRRRLPNRVSSVLLLFTDTATTRIHDTGEPVMLDHMALTPSTMVLLALKPSTVAPARWWDAGAKGLEEGVQDEPAPPGPF